MSIIESLKLLVGYSGNDLDHIFAIISIFVVLMVLYMLINILNSVFRMK